MILFAITVLFGHTCKPRASGDDPWVLVEAVFEGA